MTDDFRQAMLLNLRAQIESLVSQREAMIAANKSREHRGEAPAYGEKAFQENADSLACVLPDPHHFE